MRLFLYTRLISLYKVFVILYLPALWLRITYLTLFSYLHFLTIFQMLVSCWGFMPHFLLELWLSQQTSEIWLIRWAAKNTSLNIGDQFYKVFVWDRTFCACFFFFFLHNKVQIILRHSFSFYSTVRCRTACVRLGQWGIRV